MENMLKTRGTGIKKALKIVGAILLTAIIGIVVLLKYLGSRPAAPADYQQSVETGLLS